MNFNQELNGQLLGLGASIEKMKKLTDSAIKTLPEEKRNILAPAQRAMTEALTAMKNRDTSKLNDLMNNIEKLKNDAGIN